MKVKIRKIGNSLGILLPKDTLTLLGLGAGDEVELGAKAKQIELILKKDKQRNLNPESLKETKA